SPGSISPSSVFQNNLVYGNQRDWYYNNRGTLTTLQAAGMTVSGTVTASPGFVDAAHGNYHLATGSPAIDVGVSAGSPARHLEGFSRPYGARVDLGVYEWHP